MCVFQPTYKRRDGTSAHTTRYYVEFYDHNRCRHRVPAYEDEAATRDLNRRIVEFVAARDANRPIDAEARRWAGTLPRKLRRRLADSLRFSTFAHAKNGLSSEAVPSLGDGASGAVVALLRCEPERRGTRRCLRTAQRGQADATACHAMP